MATITHTVPRSARGELLEKWLAKNVPGLALDRARALLDGGHVQMRGKVVNAGRRLWGGEEIVLTPPAPRPPAFPTSGPAVPVLHDDEALVVIDKPAGLTVEPEGALPSVVGVLSAQLGGFDVQGVAAPGVVHRLDRRTTGCLALAKTDAAVAALQQAFAGKRIDKRYLVVVLGEPPDTMRLDTPYNRDPEEPRRYTTRHPSPRRAVLSFDVRERFADAALLEVQLETGRTHQIRVQLTEAGFPVLGDPIYGEMGARTHPAAKALGRQALHAWRLALPHPTSGVELRFEAPIPRDFDEALRTLRGG